MSKILKHFVCGVACSIIGYDLSRSVDTNSSTRINNSLVSPRVLIMPPQVRVTHRTCLNWMSHLGLEIRARISIAYKKRGACITTMMGTAIWRTIRRVGAWPAVPRSFSVLMRAIKAFKSAKRHGMKGQWAEKSSICGSCLADDY